MKTLFASCLVITTVCIIGCTDNNRARSGGTMDFKLPPARKLINATWKDTELWYLTRPMRPDESPEVVIFQEKSPWGIREGRVNFIESK